MDTLIVWKSLILFLFTFYFFWILFYTFQPDFLDNQDKARQGLRGCVGDDCYLSARGRTKVFLYSLIPAGSFTLAYIVYCVYFSRKSVTIKCSKKAKKLGQCKIQR